MPKFLEEEDKRTLEIDKSVKNKWRWEWLRERGPDKDGATRKGDEHRVWCCKTDQPGECFCLDCGKIDRYGTMGKKIFLKHCINPCTREGCDWTFTTAYKLKRHEESHEGKKDFYCDIGGCSRKFTTIYNLKSHQRLHNRPLTERCPEQGCDARFPTKRHLEAHMKTHSGIEKTYHCSHPGCSAVFHSSISVRAHARNHKERDTDLRCNFEGCGKIFDRLCRLKQHVRQHTGEKPYVCNFEGCTWAFTTASKLKRHSAKHLNLRKFKCDQCDKRFMRPEHLKGHLITHTGIKPFTCPVQGCDASFTAKSSLYVHLTKHDKDGGKIVFHCFIDGCSRKYKTKLQLRAHMLKHLMTGTDLDTGGIGGREAAQILMSCTSDNDEQDKLTGEVDGVREEEEEDSEQFREGGVEVSADHLTSAAVTQLLSSPVTISVEPSGIAQPTIKLESSSSQAVYLKNRSGCARTDFQSNHLLSNQARQRWHLQRDDSAQLTSSMEIDVSPVQSVAGGDMMLGLVKQESEMFAASESTLSGLSFRDPETGLTYVQTQLLQAEEAERVHKLELVTESNALRKRAKEKEAELQQLQKEIDQRSSDDDPPQTVYYSNDPMGLNSASGDVNTSLLDMVPLHYPNTTINLNDLV